MKKTVIGTCGHEIDIEVFGTADQRERKIKYYESCVCKECLAKANAEELANEIESGWCELEGSEKQVAWAARIRRERAKEVQKMIKNAYDQNMAAIAKMTNEADVKRLTEETEKGKEFCEAIAEKMTTKIASASWWIDSRDMTTNSFFAKARDFEA